MPGFSLALGGAGELEAGRGPGAQMPGFSAAACPLISGAAYAQG